MHSWACVATGDPPAWTALSPRSQPCIPNSESRASRVYSASASRVASAAARSPPLPAIRLPMSKRSEESFDPLAGSVSLDVPVSVGLPASLDGST